MPIIPEEPKEVPTFLIYLTNSFCNITLNIYIMTQPLTKKKCPKCGKTFVANHYVCPNCNPKKSVMMSGLNFLGDVIKFMGK